jgi:hypothetical protein
LEKNKKLSFKFNELANTGLLWDKIQESRQNETISYLIFIGGSILFTGAFIDTITSTENLNWFLFIPYRLGSQNINFVNLFMELCGFMFLTIGISSSIYYKLNKEHYLKYLKIDNKNPLLADQGTKVFAKQLMKDQNELRECKLYIMEQYGQNEIDSIHYCKLLGNHWQELVEENKLLSFKNY